MFRSKNFRRMQTAGVSAAAIALAAFGGAAIASAQNTDSAPALSGTMQNGAPFCIVPLSAGAESVFCALAIAAPPKAARAMAAAETPAVCMRRKFLLLNILDIRSLRRNY